MDPVTVGRYSPQDGVNPPGQQGVTWLGWVSTKDWVVWEADDGNLYVCNGLSDDGAIKSDPVVVCRA